MRKASWGAVLELGVVFAVIFCFSELSLAVPVSLSWGEGDAGRAVKDESGDLLIGNINEAADSDYVQLIYAGADEAADIPTWSGGVTGDDQIVATSYLGAGRAPFLSDEGLWALTGTDITAYAVDSKFYARAWNASDSSQWTHYGDSPDLYTVTAAEIQTYDNAGNFSTTNSLIPTLTIDSVSAVGGDIPLQVTFKVTGDSEPGDDNLDYYFDYDGDGNFDEHVAEADETQVTTTYLYTVAGSYTVKIKAVDSADSLVVENTSTVITVTQAPTLQAWLIQPGTGDTFGGTAVTLRAGATPQNQIERIKFQYNDGAWQDIGSWIAPPLLRTTWDVSGVADGGYDLRVVAEDTSGDTINSDSVTITVDNSDPDNTEGPGDSGTHSKRKTISKDKTEVISIYEGTEIEVVYGAISADSVVDIKLTGTSSNAPNGAAVGKTDINATREFSIDGVTVPSEAVIIKIPYPDADDDGKVDGTSVDETTLKVYWYDEAAGEWTLAVSTAVNATENYVTASVVHLSEFGVFGDTVASSGGGGCFLSVSSIKNGEEEINPPLSSNP